MVQGIIGWLLVSIVAFNPYVVFARESKRATELFDVDFSTDANGGCAYITEAEIDLQLEEAYEILGMGISLVTDYGDFGEATRLLRAFFKPRPTEAHLRDLESKYEAVLDFLKNGKLFGGHKPFLFCNSNWLALKDPSDAAQEADGDIMYHDPPDNTRPFTIADMQSRDGADGMGYWWASRMNAYLVLPGDIEDTYCERSSGNKGVTTEADPDGRPYIPYHSITICPNGFAPRGRRRHGGTPRPVPRDSINDNSQSIEDMYPGAMTLMHELFHLVLGNAKTFINPAKQEEEYNPSNLVKLTAAKALKNPESMVAVAVAFDLTENLPANGGNLVEFHLGVTTQG